MRVNFIFFTCYWRKRLVSSTVYNSTCNFSAIIFEFDIEWVFFSTVYIDFFSSFIRVWNLYCWCYYWRCRSYWSCWCCWVNKICCCNLIFWSIRISDSKVPFFIHTVLWICWKTWVSSFNRGDNLVLIIFTKIIRIRNI